MNMYDYQLRFKNNHKVLLALQGVIAGHWRDNQMDNNHNAQIGYQISPLIIGLQQVRNQKEFDDWNMLIQDFLKLLKDIIEMAEDFDIDALSQTFLTELIDLICQLN